MQILRRGGEGDEVRRWQRFLIGQGLLKSAADGVFGPITERATKAFQRRAKIDVDGLTELNLTWDGSFVPRFVRGSRTTLSNHAWGTAFDVNYQWNRLGAVPALRGEKGSVRDLVPVAHDHGFYWGGHFSRRDGMHFEVARVQ